MSEAVLQRRVGAGAFTPTEDKVGGAAAGAVVGGLLGALLGSAGDMMGWGALAGVLAGGAGGFLIGRARANASIPSPNTGASINTQPNTGASTSPIPTVGG